ncbi:MAG: hypothetical protein INQ03_10270 [Candidatus Heimdallarchaeota archaeon]|nr:hypothetical protein [Candidatus Heimdallarchaeota archaeon]
MEDIVTHIPSDGKSNIILTSISKKLKIDDVSKIKFLASYVDFHRVYHFKYNIKKDFHAHGKRIRRVREKGEVYYDGDVYYSKPGSTKYKEEWINELSYLPWDTFGITNLEFNPLPGLFEEMVNRFQSEVTYEIKKRNSITTYSAVTTVLPQDMNIEPLSQLMKLVLGEIYFTTNGEEYYIYTYGNSPKKGDIIGKPKGMCQICLRLDKNIKSCQICKQPICFDCSKYNKSFLKKKYFCKNCEYEAIKADPQLNLQSSDILSRHYLYENNRFQDYFLNKYGKVNDEVIVYPNLMEYKDFNISYSSEDTKAFEYFLKRINEIYDNLKEQSPDTWLDFELKKNILLLKANDLLNTNLGIIEFSDLLINITKSSIIIYNEIQKSISSFSNVPIFDFDKTFIRVINYDLYNFISLFTYYMEIYGRVASRVLMSNVFEMFEKLNRGTELLDLSSRFQNETDILSIKESHELILSKIFYYFKVTEIKDHLDTIEIGNDMSFNVISKIPEVKIILERGFASSIKKVMEDLIRFFDMADRIDLENEIFRNDIRMIEINGIMIRICCNANAKLEKQYCECGRVIDNSIIEYYLNSSS